jgi:hypothetical protein
MKVLTIKKQKNGSIKTAFEKRSMTLYAWKKKRRKEA